MNDDRVKKDVMSYVIFTNKGKKLSTKSVLHVQNNFVKQTLPFKGHLYRID